MPRWQTLVLGAVGFVGGYYIVKHYFVSGGRIV